MTAYVRLLGRRPLYRGWLIAAVMFLSSAVNIGGSQYAFGLFIDPLQEAFGWSRTQISLSLSFAAVGSLAAPLVGWLMDRHGARPVMVGSLLLIGASFLMRPLMTELWHWYALSALQYVGFSGAAGLTTARLVGLWFRRTRGRMMGLTAMGNNFGGLIVPPTVAAVLSATSWRGGYLALGAMVAAVLLIAAVVIRDRPDQGPSADRGPRATPEPSHADLEGWSLRDALASRAFYAVAAVMLMATFSRITVIPQLIAHLTGLGISVALASLALSVLAGMGMGGKVAFGFLGEKLTARRALMVCFLGQGATLLLFPEVSSPALLWTALPLYGFFLGGFGALFQLVIQETFGLRRYGSIAGLVNMTTLVSFSLGPVVAGLTYDLTGSYGPAFVGVSGMMVLAALALTQVRMARAPSTGGPAVAERR